MKDKIIGLFLLLLAIVIAESCQSNPYKQGEALYTNFCASCHQAGGKSFEKLMPPLAQSDYLTEHKADLACIIRYGLEGEITVNGKKYNAVMGELPSLKEVEITNIINYINNSWGNNNGYTPLKEVQKSLENCDK